MSDERLAILNKVLKERDLRQLNYLGDSSKGETEILDISSIHDYNSKFFTDIVFTVRFPNGSEGAYAIRFNASGSVSDGSVIVPVVADQDKFILVRQYRPACGRWMLEAPRGFSTPDDYFQPNANWILPQKGNICVKDIGALKALRELTEEVGEITITGIKWLGEIAQDSSTHSVFPNFYLVTCLPDAGPQKLDPSESIKVELLSSLEVRTKIRQHAISDSHSLVALFLSFVELGI